jgi:hypothetical protein
MYEQLKNHSDEELLALIQLAKEILSERDKQYKQETMRKIRELAADAGLAVQIKSKRKYTKRTKIDNGSNDDERDNQNTH